MVWYQERHTHTPSISESNRFVEKLATTSICRCSDAVVQLHSEQKQFKWRPLNEETRELAKIAMGQYRFFHQTWAKVNQNGGCAGRREKFNSTNRLPHGKLTSTLISLLIGVISG